MGFWGHAGDSLQDLHAIPCISIWTAERVRDEDTFPLILCQSQFGPPHMTCHTAMWLIFGLFE